MSKLEELVPSPNLCKLIPGGEFKDTALVWFQMYQGEKHRLGRRDSLVNATSAISAPTFNEIIDELPAWEIQEDLLYTFNRTERALKIWLKMKGIKYEK